MPRIDPNQLLKCLSSLLGTNGGIKSSEEVKRISNLMQKFSKKLVSKCIYLQILKSTQCDLLEEFMDEGGWGLVFQWLDDAIVNNNYPVIREILELLLLCPISIDRLKENNSPKVIKGLSKGSEDEQVKLLAGILVEQWLKDIKSGTISDKAAKKKKEITNEVIPSPTPAPPPVPQPQPQPQPSKTVLIRPVSLQSPAQSVSNIKIAKSVKIIQENDKSSSEDEEVPPIGSLPLYKITVRDGKSVLAKVGTKTLSLPTKKPENESPIVLKSEAGSKKFRFVAKVVDKDKSDASEINSDDSSSRDKSEQGKSETKVTGDKSDETDSSEKSDSKSKISSSKSKDVKSKDSHSKSSKSHSDRDKSDSRHKDKEKDKDRKEGSSSGSSNKDDRKKSEHKSHKSDKDRDREKDKSKHKESSSKDKHHKSSSSSSSSSLRDKEKDKKDSKPEKSLSAAEKAQIQADKDKDTLERLKTPSMSSLGKIPKKSSSQSSSSSKNSSNSSSTKVSDSPLSDKSSDGKKSGDVKRTEIKGPKPKTVKTFNSKFRSTGLEEEIKPPPPRNSIKKKVEEKKPPVVGKIETLKHLSSSPKDGSPPEKKSKIAEVIAEKKDKILDKPGGIKLIPPKPKPTLLESDMFSDALIASTKLEPRKRKRRTSSSKDGPDVKKEIKEEPSESPKDVKPNLKFYRDTLEDDEEKNKENLTDIKTEIKTESDSEESKQAGSNDSEDNKPVCKLYPNGVLVHRARKGPKKSVKWKEEADLIAVKLFELDETERVNVTRNFVDMKLIERSHEREAFRMARKLASEDIMEEKIPWGPLYEVDIPPERRPAVEPGRSSEEKNVQYAREKTVLQAIYMYRSAIPDSPAEPDIESHPTTDPKIIPLEDITGNADSVSDFTNIPWPEPKPALIPSSPPPTQTMTPATGAVGFPPGYSTVGNFAGFPQMGMPGVMPTAQGTWRTPDGKEMPMNMPFTPNGPMCPPNMAGPPTMYPTGPENYNMNGPQMAGYNPGFPMGCDPSMYGPPPMGGMNPAGPPPNWNRGGWQGPPRGPCPPMNMPPKFPKGVCHHFAKFGSCSRGSSCRFMHPGVNCPPLT